MSLGQQRLNQRLNLLPHRNTKFFFILYTLISKNKDFKEALHFNKIMILFMNSVSGQNTRKTAI